MIENIPSVYNQQSVYNQGGGGGGEIENINDYFENVYIWWNNQYNYYSVFQPVANFNNENLFVMNKLYCPNSFSQGDYAFLASDTSQFNVAKIRVKIAGGNSWLDNGNHADVNCQNFNAGEMLLKVEGNSFTFNGVSYAGGYSPATVNYIWPIPSAPGNDPKMPYSHMAFKELLMMDKLTNKVYAHYYGVKRVSDNALGVFDMCTGNFYQSPFFSMYNI